MCHPIPTPTDDSLAGCGLQIVDAMGLDGQEFTTKPKKKTLNPTWNERWEGGLV